jgi:hypothetical protein
MGYKEDKDAAVEKLYTAARIAYDEIGHALSTKTATRGLLFASARLSGALEAIEEFLIDATVEGANDEVEKLREKGGA